MAESVLFVDRKNSCLSAMAEFAFRKATGFRVPVSSAGIEPSDGFLDWGVRELLRDEGFDFEMFLSFRSKEISEELVSGHDVVLAFNGEDLELLRSRFPAHSHKFRLLSEFAGGSGDVRDPCDESWRSEGKFKEAYDALYGYSSAVGKGLSPVH